MKILFSLFISLSIILFSVAQTITDGSATLTMTQDYITGTGCGSNGYFDAGNGIDQLFGMDWYIGIGAMNSENFPYPDTYTVENNTITAEYANLLYTSGLSAELIITITELAPLDVQITQIMQITNNTGAPLDIRLFNYLDLDKNNTQSDDGILFLEDDCNLSTQISDTDDPSQTCYYTINASDGYEIASFPNLCNSLLAGINNLSNTGLPLSASDHTQALQYNATIPSGGVTAAEALLTFGNPPEPATTDASGQCTFQGGGEPPSFDCTTNPIIINHNVVCDQMNSRYDVHFSISGGGAGSQGGVYTVTGDFGGTVDAGDVTTIYGLAEGSTYNITVIDDGFGCSASISNGPNTCSKLPVELLDYNGEALTEGNLLKWITASEIENDYFSLFSSIDGKDFELIHQEEGAGTISTAQQYQFLDRNAASGITYYQLQQTDFDGTTKNVGHTSVARGEQLDMVLLDSFPNPFSNELSLNIYSNSNYRVVLRLTDMHGSNVIQHQLNLQSGNNTIQLETDNISKGLYLLNVQSKKDKQVYKLLKN